MNLYNKLGFVFALSCILMLPISANAAYVWNKIGENRLGAATGNGIGGSIATIFDDKVYVAATSGAGSGVRIYMCDPALDGSTIDDQGCDEADGDGFIPVNTAGFGYVKNEQVNFNAFGSFNVGGTDYLYAGTYAASGGGELWRCSATSGCDEQADWLKVHDYGGFGSGSDDETNPSFTSIEIFGSSMYVGVKDATNGAEVFRCALATGCDGQTDWGGANPVPISTGGLGSSTEESINALESFDGKLFAATSVSAGARIYACSTCDGTDWGSSIITDGFNGNNSEIYSLYGFGTDIYAGTLNTTDGGQLWSCTATPDCIAQGNWTPEDSGGFGDSNQWLTLASKEFSGLFIGSSTYDDTTKSGSLIMSSSDGSSWSEASPAGMDGVSQNYIMFPIGSADGHLYAMTGDTSTGLEVWRTDGTGEPVIAEFKTIFIFALAAILAGGGFVLIRRVRTRKA